MLMDSWLSFCNKDKNYLTQHIENGDKIYFLLKS